MQTSGGGHHPELMASGQFLPNIGLLKTRRPSFLLTEWRNLPATAQMLTGVASSPKTARPDNDPSVLRFSAKVQRASHRGASRRIRFVISFIEVCGARAQIAVSNRSLEQIFTALYKLESKGVIGMCSVLRG